MKAARCKAVLFLGPLASIATDFWSNKNLTSSAWPCNTAWFWKKMWLIQHLVDFNCILDSICFFKERMLSLYLAWEEWHCSSPLCWCRLSFSWESCVLFGCPQPWQQQRRVDVCPCLLAETVLKEQSSQHTHHNSKSSNEKEIVMMIACHQFILWHTSKDRKNAHLHAKIKSLLPCLMAFSSCLLPFSAFFRSFLAFFLTFRSLKDRDLKSFLALLSFSTGFFFRELIWMIELIR